MVISQLGQLQHFYDIHKFQLCLAVPHDIHSLLFPIFMLPSQILNDRWMRNSAVPGVVFIASLKYLSPVININTF